MKSCETLESMLKNSSGDREKTCEIVARTFYSILRQNGFTHSEVMDVTGHILEGVIKDIKINGKEKVDPVNILDTSRRPPSEEVA